MADGEVPMRKASQNGMASINLDRPTHVCFVANILITQLSVLCLSSSHLHLQTRLSHVCSIVLRSVMYNIPTHHQQSCSSLSQ